MTDTKKIYLKQNNSHDIVTGILLNLQSEGFLFFESHKRDTCVGSGWGTLDLSETPIPYLKAKIISLGPPISLDFTEAHIV